MVRQLPMLHQPPITMLFGLRSWCGQDVQQKHSSHSMGFLRAVRPHSPVIDQAPCHLCDVACILPVLDVSCEGQHSGVGRLDAQLEAEGV